MRRDIGWVASVLLLFASLLVAAGAPAAAHDGDDFEVTEVAFVGSATDLDFLPDGRMLVSTKLGQVRIVDDGVVLPTPALDISATVCTEVERGLSGITLHPDFAQNGWVYVFYTYPKHGNCGFSGTTGPANRAERYTIVGDTFDLQSALTIVESPEMYGGHHASGHMEFGNDGYLYISMGDGNSPRPLGLPRDPGILYGKIVRVTDDGDIPPGNPYSGPTSADCSADGRIPSGSTATECQQVFAMGLRNPFRLAFDPDTTDTRFYINDVGQAHWEEVNLGQAGADYGWPDREGPCVFGSETDCSVPAGMVDPIHWYSHNGGGAAITGGAFVPDGVWPSAFDGLYLFGKYVADQIVVMEPGGPDCRTCVPPTSPYFDDLFIDAIVRPINLQFGPHGAGQALYGLFQGGFIRRIAYVGDANRTPVARASATPVAGDLPLLVNFTGSTSSDPDDDPLTYVWDFGDGTTSTLADPSHTYTAAATYDVTLTVDDGNGGTAAAALRIDPGNNPPAASIDGPLAGTEFTVGQQLTLTGSAVDPEEGVVPAGQLTWEVLLHHNTHVHPYLDPTAGNNLVITAPAPEDVFAAQDSYLEVILTAVDSQGVAHTVTRDVQPAKTNLTFESTPPGLDLVIDDYTFATPTTLVSWEGHDLSIIAETQDLGGVTYSWQSWSQGGPAEQVVSVPAADTTYLASFAPPAVSPGVMSVLEGDTGSTVVDLPVSLSSVSNQPVSVDWQMELGLTSVTIDDVVESSGTITFVPGQLSATIPIELIGETLFEPNEILILSFSNPTAGATIGGFYGLGLLGITNDDAPPVITPGFVQQAEGTGGVTDFVIPVTLSGPSQTPTTADWVTFDFLATTPEDYAATSGQLVVAPGETTGSVTVSVVGDRDVEDNESFVALFHNPVGATIGGFFGLGVGIIVDDD